MSKKCDCVERINKMYGPQGAYLDTIPITDMQTGSVVNELFYLPLRSATTGRLIPWRKKSITPTFCPFCGVRLQDE